jgi:hypothetical protein
LQKIDIITMKFSFLLLTILFMGFQSYSQIKQEFQNELELQKQKNLFSKKLIQLNTLLKNGLAGLHVDSLKNSGGFDFLEKKNIPSGDILIIDVIPLWSDAYFFLEKEGKINNLKSLRQAGKLKLTGRNIANEVELPKKANKSQSDNDFYLGVIKQLLNKGNNALQQDHLDFATYQSWEKGAGVTTEFDIREYRTSFILFIYKHYNLNQ